MTAYFHYNEPLSNTDTGQGLIGYFVRVIDPTTNAVVPIYADENATPISSVSGSDNLAKSDADSMVSFYVVPANAYHLDVYAPDGQTFLKRYPNQSMASTVGPQGPKGDPGAAGNVAASLAELKATLTTNDTMIYDHATFKWTTGDYTGQADDVNIIQSDLAAISTGAWVRQSAASIQASDGNTVQANIDALQAAGLRLSSEFGDKGPGYDNTAAINDWLTYIRNMNGRRGGVLMPWESYCATPIDLSAADLDGVSLFGAQGRSFLTSDAAYHVLRLGNTKGVEINGIGFRSDYANAAIDKASAVVYSSQNSHADTIFRRCSFSAPNANTSGLSLYTAINYLDSAASVDGFLIEDCAFENLGCQGSTIMNRSNDPSRMKRVHFIRCVARRLGLKGNYGFAVSFDGTGDQCSYQDGWLEDLFGIGLENVGYHNTHFLRNTGINFSRGWGMLSINGTRADDPDTWGPEAGVAQTMYGCRIEGNRQIGDSTGALSSYVSDLERSSTWRDNDLFANSASVILALTVRRCSDLKFTNGSYVNYAGTGGYAVLVDSGTTQPVTRCTFDGCYADNSASGANGQAVIGFSGSVATNNLITNAMLKKASAGFTVAQNSSAVGSVCDPYVDGSGNRIGEYLSLNMGDADVTLSGEQAMLRYKAIRIPAGNTLTRNLNFPSRRQIEQAPRVINNGTTAVQLQCAGVNGSALAGGASATLVYDSAIGSVRAI